MKSKLSPWTSTIVKRSSIFTLRWRYEGSTADEEEIFYTFCKGITKNATGINFLDVQKVKRGETIIKVTFIVHGISTAEGIASCFLERSGGSVTLGFPMYLTVDKEEENNERNQKLYFFSMGPIGSIYTIKGR